MEKNRVWFIYLKFNLNRLVSVPCLLHWFRSGKAAGDSPPRATERGGATSAGLNHQAILRQRSCQAFALHTRGESHSQNRADRPEILWKPEANTRGNQKQTHED